MRDLSTKARLYLGERQAEAMQGYQSLTLVASQLFGSEKGSKGGSAGAQEPKTAAELQAAFHSVFGS